MEKFPGGEILKRKYPDLSKSDQVNLSVEDINDARKSIEITPELTKEEKIDYWLDATEDFHKRHRDDPEAVEYIQEAFYDKYVIKPEDIPENYFKNQQRMARELGHGNIEITEETKNQASKVIINDQKTSLNKWTDYLFHKDTDIYPMWAKYWALRSMTKLSAYNKEKKGFGNRRKDTTAPFPDLDREALAHVINAIVKKANDEKIEIAEDDPDLQKLIQSENFGKLYAYTIEKVTPAEENELLTTEGEWIKYPQNSDHMPLIESLQGHGTGWCTAEESTAESHLNGGDFYVYYSNNNEDGKPTVPRIAIRMQKNKIGEIRGIAPDQNIDSNIQDILDEKLSEFPDKDNFQKKTADMKFLTEIEKKISKEELNVDELKFLYEFNSKIEGFGYREDPRIKKIKEGRDIKADLFLITGYSKEQISTTEEEALDNGIKFHYGDLDLRSLESAEGSELPEIVNGNLRLYDLRSAKGLKLPKIVNGNINLNSLESAEGLELPETINGGLWIDNLESAKELKFPETINGHLIFNSLRSAEKLKLPETINGNLYLNSLESDKGLELPKTIDGSLNLDSLTSAEELELPKIVNGNINLNSLASAEGLKLPKIVNGSLNLDSLESAEGLELPETINGSLNLDSLESAEGLEFPVLIGDDLSLDNLKSVKGLKLPTLVNGYLNIDSLKYAEGLKLPETVGESLSLNSLESAKGLEFPKTVGSNLSLSSLKSAEGLKLPETIGSYLNLYSLESAEGLKLPDTISGDLSLNSLESAEGLEFPKTVTANLKLCNLRSAEGLKLPETIGNDLSLSSLKSAEGLKLPALINGNLNLDSLEPAKKENLKKKYPSFKII